MEAKQTNQQKHASRNTQNASVLPVYDDVTHKNAILNCQINRTPMTQSHSLYHYVHEYVMSFNKLGKEWESISHLLAIV